MTKFVFLRPVSCGSVPKRDIEAVIKLTNGAKNSNSVPGKKCLVFLDLKPASAFAHLLSGEDGADFNFQSLVVSEWADYKTVFIQLTGNLGDKSFDFRS